MQYVMGDRVVSESELKAMAPKAKVRKPAEIEAYHKGWRVEGVPPGSEDDAREAFGIDPKGKTFDPENWLMTFKAKAVRSKPYELIEAAEQCKMLAEKAGWRRVSIREIKRVVA